jgi:8-oxo-dGTP pyrophosphatase MutT (NUDIX family)
MGHFVEALPYTAQAQLAERGPIALGNGPVSEQAEQQRWMGPVQKLEGARGIGRIHLVPAKLRLERIERPVHLATSAAAEAHPVGHNAGLAQGGPGGVVSAARRGGHMGILRAEGDWQALVARALAAVERPIPVDPRFVPRRAVPDPALAAEDARRFDRSRFPTARDAATLLLIYPAEAELVIPLTVRHAALASHPGEISLPGGAVEEGDASLEDAALREAQEEIGLDPASVRVVGRLDPVWIPVSNFELVPIVAVADHRPGLTLGLDEVTELIELPLDRLLAPDGVTEEEITVPGVVLRTGVYFWGGHRIWGATARTLSMLGTALASAG